MDSGSTSLTGFLVVRGKDISRRVRIECRNIDILPTLLNVLGLPSAELAGHSVLMRQSELDEVNEQLVGLGYI